MKFSLYLFHKKENKLALQSKETQRLAKVFDERTTRLIKTMSTPVTVGTVVFPFPDLRIKLSDTPDELILQYLEGHLIVSTEDLLAVGDFVVMMPTPGRQRYIVLGKVRQDRFHEIVNVAVPFVIDGGGFPPNVGLSGRIELPFGMKVLGWTITSDVVGSIVIDIWKSTYAAFPPTAGDTITGTEKPTLASADKNQDLDLTTWTIDIVAGDWLAFVVDSAATLTKVTVSLRGIKT